MGRTHQVKYTGKDICKRQVVLDSLVWGLWEEARPPSTSQATCLSPLPGGGVSLSTSLILGRSMIALTNRIQWKQCWASSGSRPGGFYFLPLGHQPPRKKCSRPEITRLWEAQAMRPWRTRCHMERGRKKETGQGALRWQTREWRNRLWSRSWIANAPAEATWSRQIAQLSPTQIWTHKTVGKISYFKPLCLGFVYEATTAPGTLLETVVHVRKFGHHLGSNREPLKPSGPMGDRTRVEAVVTLAAT